MRVVIGSDMTERPPAVVTEARRRAASHQMDLVGPLAGGSEEWAEVGAPAVAGLPRPLSTLPSCSVGRGPGSRSPPTGCPASGLRCAAIPRPPGSRARTHHANIVVMSLRATSKHVGREIGDAFLSEPYGDEDFDGRNVRVVDALDESPVGDAGRQSLASAVSRSSCKGSDSAGAAIGPTRSGKLNFRSSSSVSDSTEGTRGPPV